MPWVDEAAPVRRRALAALLPGAMSQLHEVRAALHVVQVTTRRRELGRQGHSHIKKLVIIQLLSKYRLDQTMTLMIAKLLLPRSVWEACDLVAGQTRAAYLRGLITHRKIIAQADKVWRRRALASSVRVLSRVKRLVAEYRVYQKLLHMNQRGVTPKRAEMVSWLNRFWPRSGDATDALLARLEASVKSVIKWMRRFRRFWHISFGKLPVRNELTPEMEGFKVL